MLDEVQERIFFIKFLFIIFLGGIYSMKKLVSLGVVSAMVASMMSIVPAVHGMEEITDKKLSDMNVFELKDVNESLSSRSMAKATRLDMSVKTEDGVSLKDCVVVSGSQPTETLLVFGVSKTALFAKHAKKPETMPFFRCASKSPVKCTTYSGISNAGGISCSSTTAKVNVVGFGEVAVPVVKIKYTNTSSNDKRSVFTVTLKDYNNNEREIHVIATANGIDHEDTSAAEVEKNDAGIREYNDGTQMSSGTIITSANLREMVGKGEYQFTTEGGVSMVASITKAIADAGKTPFIAEVEADAHLLGRYKESGAVGTLYAPTFKDSAKRKVNIDFNNSIVRSVYGEDFCVKVSDGDFNKLYVYPVSESGRGALIANASGNDGVIDTDKVISVTPLDGVIAFTMDQGVERVLISTKEIDVEKLPAVSGVEIPAASTAADNEITAPSLDSVIASESSISGAASAASIVAPSIVSAPIMDVAPAATNAGQQNTGASDVVTLAVVLAVISMAAAGAVAYKKF